jgi:hypothetical protein
VLLRRQAESSARPDQRLLRCEVMEPALQVEVVQAFVQVVLIDVPAECNMA